MLASSLMLGASVVVFILDDISAYEIEEDLVRTPVIDSLAAQGVSFTRAYSNASCNVTRHSFVFSDWNAVRHGFACGPANELTITLDELSGVTFPKPFAVQGYETAHFGKGHMGTSFFSGGGDEWKYIFRLLGYDHWLAGTPHNVQQACEGDGPFGYFNWHRVDDDVVSFSTEYHTLAVTDAFQTWWSNTPGDKMAVVAMQAAHRPHHVPPAEALPPGFPNPGPNARDKYEAMVASGDFAIGQMLSVVDRENTIVVVFSDNGTTKQVVHWSHDDTHGKHTVFEDGVRVPFVITGPGVPVGGVSDELIHVVDVLPTLAEMIGVPVEADGSSFFPALHGFPLGRPYVYVVNDEGREALITRRWKLRVKDGVEVLFDLETDPEELDPLDPRGWPNIATRLRAYMAEAKADPSTDRGASLVRGDLPATMPPVPVDRR